MGAGQKSVEVAEGYSGPGSQVWLRQASAEGVCGLQLCGEYGYCHVHTGCAFELNCGAVVWANKMQESASKSLSEYIAAASGAKEMVWLCAVLRGMGQTDAVRESSPVCIENHGNLLLVLSPLTNQKTKHISIAYHFRE
jgi:hypothetical protein